MRTQIGTIECEQAAPNPLQSATMPQIIDCLTGHAGRHSVTHAKCLTAQGSSQHDFYLLRSAHSTWLTIGVF